MIKYRSVFLIDDDEDDQLLFSDAITEIDPSIKCDMAGNGIEALRKLSGRQVSPDIIFLDLNMPLMNGFEFLTEVRAMSFLSEVPIVIFTTSNNLEHAIRTFELGASAFLTKPAGFDVLRTKLRSTLKAEFAERKNLQISDYLI